MWVSFKFSLNFYRWIATNLKMGAPSYVQSLVCLHRKNKDSKLWKQLLKQG